MKNCIIFDLDGTLVDSSYGIVASVNTAREHFGLEALEQTQILHAINDPSVHLPQLFYGTDEYTKEQSRVFERAYFNECTNNLRLHDGVKELLVELSRENYLAVASNSYEHFIDRMLEFCGIDEFFVKVIGADTFGISKPDPYMVNHILQSLKPTKAILVGDSTKDKLCANSANIPFISVDWGFSKTVGDINVNDSASLGEAIKSLLK